MTGSRKTTPPRGNAIPKPMERPIAQVIMVDFAAKQRKPIEEQTRELAATKKELSQEREIILTAIGQLDSEVAKITEQAAEQKRALDTINRKQALLVDLARGKKLKHGTEAEINALEEKEKCLVDLRDQYDNIRDLLIQNKIDMIIETQDPLKIKEAVAQAKSLPTGIWSTYIDDSKGKPHRVSNSSLLAAIDALEKELKKLSDRKIKTPERKETLEERLKKNPHYEELQMKLAALKTTIMVDEADFAGVETELEPLKERVQKDRIRELEERQKEINEKFRRITRITDFLAVGAVVGATGAAIASTGITTSAATFAAAALSPLIVRAFRTKLSLSILSDNEMEKFVRQMCETKLTHLEGKLEEKQEMKLNLISALAAENKD